MVMARVNTSLKLFHIFLVNLEMENVMNQDAPLAQTLQENKPLPTDCILCSIG